MFIGEMGEKYNYIFFILVTWYPSIISTYLLIIVKHDISRVKDSSTSIYNLRYICNLFAPFNILICYSDTKILYKNDQMQAEIILCIMYH